jgi:L-ascorbate metabolism protein UlaG (beta-lactamase superfamily)
MRMNRFLTGAALAALAGCGILYGALSIPSFAAQSYPVAQRATGKRDLTVRFLGTATLAFDDGTTAIMTDGFFTRPSVAQVLLGKVQSDDRVIDKTLARIGPQNLAAIFVAHSHYDHAMDSAAVAVKTGASVYGSASTANIMRGAGLPTERTTVFEDGDTYAFGTFRVQVFETPHSPHAKFPGKIDEPLHQPARISEYQEGGNYSFLVTHGKRRILVIASGNYTPGKFQGVKADVVFLGIGTLGKQDEAFASNYWHETVEQTGAKLVIPIHWDDFMRPLDQPFRPLPRLLDNFDNGMRMLLPLAARDGVKLRLPEAFAPIDLDQ